MGIRSEAAAGSTRFQSIPKPAWGLASVLFAGFVALVCLLTSRLSHDEEQYVAAAVLALHLRPIVDFTYLQTPLQPLLLAPIVALSGTKAFLACRLASGLLGAVACSLAYPMVRTAGGDRPLATLSVVALASSTAVQAAMGSARNDALPLALALAGVVLLVQDRSPLDVGRRTLLTNGLAGLLFGAALCTKLTYVFAPSGGLFYLLASLRRPKPAATLLVFVGGVIVGLIPLLIDVAQAPHAVLFDIVEFHRRITPEWYLRNAAEAQRALGARLKFWLGAPLTDPVLFAAFGVMAWRMWSTRRALAPGVVALALLFILATVAAFAVNPPALAYLAAPAALLILTAMVAWSHAPPRSRRTRVAVPALVLLACSVGDLQLARHSLWLAKPSRWTPEALQAQSRDLRQALVTAPPGPVATVSPIRVLGAGRDIYPEFAAGPFIFRSGAAVGGPMAGRIKAATPETLEALFTRRPPAAILTGYETSWPVRADAALVAYARLHGFRSVPAPQGAMLFIRPAGRSGS